MVLLLDAALGHALVEDIERLLALAAADDLARLRRQQITAAAVRPSSLSRRSRHRHLGVQIDMYDLYQAGGVRAAGRADGPAVFPAISLLMR